jgi:hypothetical protein
MAIVYPAPRTVSEFDAGAPTTNTPWGTDTVVGYLVGAYWVRTGGTDVASDIVVEESMGTYDAAERWVDILEGGGANLAATAYLAPAAPVRIHGKLRITFTQDTDAVGILILYIDTDFVYRKK